MSPYTASKAAVIAITKTAALEYTGRNIRIIAIAPCQIDKPMVDRFFQGLEERKAQSAKGIPMRRYGKPEEIAKAALFLASDDSSFVSGQTLVVDGGQAPR